MQRAGFFVVGILHLSLHRVKNLYKLFQKAIAGKPHRIHSSQMLVKFLIFQKSYRIDAKILFDQSLN